MSSVKSVNVREMRDAITQAETQSKLALIAYSLLSIIEGEQAQQQWDAIRAKRPEREPQVGDWLKVDGRQLKIDEIEADGQLDPRTTVKASATERLRPFYGKDLGRRVWKVALDRRLIRLNETGPTPVWLLKEGVDATLVTTITRTVRGR